jgi:hypothetical protein
MKLFFIILNKIKNSIDRIIFYFGLTLHATIEKRRLINFIKKINPDSICFSLIRKNEKKITKVLNIKAIKSKDFFNKLKKKFQ